MKRILISILVSLMLVAVLAIPVMAADEQSTEASVTVGEYVSISLSGGIAFPASNPGDEDVAATTSPAVTITIEEETNVSVDIGIKGDNADGIAVGNWKYCDTAGGTKLALDTTYAVVYTNQGDGAYDFYHWVSIPSDTAAGTYHLDVYYKAVKTGGTF